MLEKLALLKMALCRAPVLTMESSAWRRAAPPFAFGREMEELGMAYPD